MKLLIDIGNTACKFSYLKDSELIYIGRLYNKEVNFDSVSSLIKEYQGNEVYISSVAPKISQNIVSILNKKEITNIKFVSIKDNHKIKINIDDENELGVDLLCDLIGAKETYGNKLAIIDFGTATKILFIDERGTFSSCSIFLGFEKSKNILSSSTELLPDVNHIDIKPISKCHNTVDVINTSAYYSQLFTIEGIINKYEEEVGYKLKRIFTGGNAINFINELGKENYDEFLLMKGLAIISKGE